MAIFRKISNGLLPYPDHNLCLIEELDFVIMAKTNRDCIVGVKRMGVTSMKLIDLWTFSVWEYFGKLWQKGNEGALQSRVVVQNVQGRHNRMYRVNKARGMQVQLVCGLRTVELGMLIPSSMALRVYHSNVYRPHSKELTLNLRDHRITSEYFERTEVLIQAQENGVALDEEQLLFITAFDFLMFDEAPTGKNHVQKIYHPQILFMMKPVRLMIRTFYLRSWLIVGVFYLVDFSFDLLLTAHIHENMKYITMDSVKPRVLAPGRYSIEVEPIPPRNKNNREVHLDYLKHLKESVETLREIVEEAKVERPLDRSLASACLYTKHSQELLEYVIGTCPKDFNKRDKKHVSTPLTRKYQVTFKDQCETSNNNIHKHVEQMNIQKTNVPVIPSTGVNSCTDASGSKPRSNTKKNRISPAKSVNKKKVEEHPRTNKSSLKNINHVDSSISSKRTVINSNSHSVCKTCRTDRHLVFGLRLLKTYDGGSLRLRNFVKKYIRTVRFGNDHFGAIMGYGDYVIGDSTKHSCYVRDTNGVELIKGSRGSNLYTISVEDMMKSSPSACCPKPPRTKHGKSKKHTHTAKTENTNLEVLNTLHMDLYGPMQVKTINGKKYILVIINDYSWFTWVKFLISKDETPEFVIKFIKQKQCQHFSPKISSEDSTAERRNRTLVEAARTTLIFSKALMFLWAEAVATAFFGALCYPINDSEDLGKLQLTTDIGIFVGYAPSRKGYRIYNKRTRRIMENIHVQFDELSELISPVQLGTGPAPSLLTPGQISLGLVPNSVPAAPYLPPTNKELEILFQPMFDEYLCYPKT
ncbi:retrovirus-related pol polyprotein from transposon TNT 1-94 [Tanacetum coccineum]